MTRYQDNQTIPIKEIHVYSNLQVNDDERLAILSVPSTKEYNIEEENKNIHLVLNLWLKVNGYRLHKDCDYVMAVRWKDFATAIVEPI